MNAAEEETNLETATRLLWKRCLNYYKDKLLIQYQEKNQFGWSPEFSSPERQDQSEFETEVFHQVSVIQDMGNMRL